MPGRTKLVPLTDAHLATIPHPAPDVPDQIIASLEEQRLRRRVRRLPARERHVICWRFGLAGELLTHRQVAERLRISVGSSWNLEQRGLARLRRSYVEPPDAPAPTTLERPRPTPRPTSPGRPELGCNPKTLAGSGTADLR